MKLFELRADFDGYCTLGFSAEEDIHVWDEGFEGTPRGASLPSVRAERREDEGACALPDFTDFALRPIPAFSEHAIDVLGELLSAHGEFVPIEVSAPTRYFAFNPTTIVDALDEERSTITYFKDGGLWRVERHVLKQTVEDLPPIFKMPQTRVGQTYVNERFTAEVARLSLTGFRFDLLT